VSTLFQAHRTRILPSYVKLQSHLGGKQSHLGVSRADHPGSKASAMEKSDIQYPYKGCMSHGRVFIVITGGHLVTGRLSGGLCSI